MPVDQLTATLRDHEPPVRRPRCSRRTARSGHGVRPADARNPAGRPPLRRTGGGVTDGEGDGACLLPELGAGFGEAQGDGTLVLRTEADVLRDEGEAYANKLRAAGVPVTAVRYQGIIHDFVMLNALRETQAAEAAISQAVTALRTAFGAE